MKRKIFLSNLHTLEFILMFTFQAYLLICCSISEISLSICPTCMLQHLIALKKWNYDQYNLGFGTRICPPKNCHINIHIPLDPYAGPPVAEYISIIFENLDMGASLRSSLETSHAWSGESKWTLLVHLSLRKQNKKLEIEHLQILVFVLLWYPRLPLHSPNYCVFDWLLVKHFEITEKAKTYIDCSLVIFILLTVTKLSAGCLFNKKSIFKGTEYGCNH